MCLLTQLVCCVTVMVYTIKSVLGTVEIGGFLFGLHSVFHSF